jgi:hypothetical protein
MRRGESGLGHRGVPRGLERSGAEVSGLHRWTQSSWRRTSVVQNERSVGDPWVTKHDRNACRAAREDKTRDRQACSPGLARERLEP